MSKKWLSIYFKISGINYNLKNKIVNSKSVLRLLYYSLLTIVFQLFFSIFSLPIYLFVSPEKVQEVGFIFPKQEKDCNRDTYLSYCTKRKISLGTTFGAGSLLFLKIFFIGIVSFFLLGGQTLLAVTQNWDLGTPGNYTYDSAKIEVTGGVARLKNLTVPASGGTTNTGFNTNATGWTGVPTWLVAPGKTNSTNYQSSGGMPGGYIDINLPGKKTNSSAGYWYQAFTTTANNPTATLSLDWKALTVTGGPSSFNLYAYIDTGSGNPTLGTEVWNSGNITAATAWASSTQINIASKVATAGTYYLKIAAYHTCTAGTDCSTVSGFDNVVLSWTGTGAPSYATDKPTINPTTSLLPVRAVSWDSFTETATKNGGEIYYQLSDDDGSTWQYWNGSVWAVAGATNYNIATDINSYIGSFSTTNNKIRWKAFLSSNGTQQVILDNIAIGYTENDLPDIINISPTQATTTPGIIAINYDITDDQSDPASLVTYEYSTTGVFGGEQVTMTASTTYPGHNGTSALTTSSTGITHLFAWDALANLGSIFDDTVYVRMRANDGIGNGAYATSTSFIVDLVNPIVSNVSAVQTPGTTNVSITYDLSDNTTANLFTELEVSNDSGATWTIPHTSVTGAIGTGVSAGTGKTITWNAGVDYDEQATSTMRVHVRARDYYYNQGTYATSSNFTIDTLNPATNVTADLKAQTNAGDTTALIGGSFTEANPNTNDFYLAINGGAYGSLSAGDTDTASPTDKATAVGATLDGNDYISKVKITHTDDYGQTKDNENLAPAVAYKYVKPYTPQAPSLSSPITTQLNLMIVPHASEAAGLEYLIQETTTGNYVQANGTLNTTPVWRTDSAWATVTVTGLTSPVANYIFQVKSRNTSDGAHAASSESAYSATAKITNTAPSISLGSIAQTTDGTKYTTINYTGTDGQGDLNNLTTYEYSRDTSSWSTITEKAGVGSDGISNLVFLSGGSAHDLMWDSGTDLSGVEDSTVYIRLRSNDGIVNSALTTSSAFEIDNVSPLVSSVTAVQNAGARTVAITYTLTDANNSLVEIDISEDGGSTWSVTDISVSGAVGAGVTAGSGKTITWNAGTDFSGQYQSDIQVRVRARDTFGNQGVYASSANFVLDTKSPVVTNVSAVQNSAVDTFTFNYDVSEDMGNVAVTLEISSNGGSTWTVPVTSATGNIGSGVAPGTGKTISWDASVDYNGYEEQDMKIRITAVDQFTNSGNNSSANFNLDTLAPRVTSVSAAQVTGSTNVSITYNLADQNNSLVEIDISEDGGSTWSVTDTSVSGDVGAGISAGAKTITWAAGTDFDEQAQADMRVRVRAKDTYNHQGANVESSNFALDTLNPTVNVTADLQAQPNAGNTSALIGGSFTEANPNTNNFYVAINGGSYGSATAGSTNTASPANQATAVGATLDGNDYISKVKITHTDDFGQIVDNENLSPATAYKYVKPYTPAPPTVFEPTVGTVRVIINQNAAETDGLEYAIYESTQNKFVQANGSLGDSAVWQTRGTGSGQWGEFSGVTGGITVTGLVNDSYTYIFQTKSRNISDSSHLASSESALSTGASSANQSPVITIDSAAQTTNGTKYVVINYTGSDLESESSSLVTYEYSLDNSAWSTMTEKTGVGSSGTSALAFTFGGSSFNFAWDVGTDLNNTEDSTVYVRLRAYDGTSNGNTVTSSAFVVDTKNPTITNETAVQTLGTKNVLINYDLADLSNSNVEIGISEDGGATWTVTSTSVSGDVGTNISSGTGKTITWNAGTDFSGQEQNDIQTRIRALDNFGNQGAYVSSANFAVDTKNPTVSNVSAVQDSGASTVTISYDLSDANNSNVEIDISGDGGSTWTVTDTSVTGNVGAGVTPGTGKSIVWNAGVDYSGNDKLNMRVRVRATDTYSNTSGNVESANFSLDTLGPSISSVSATQTLGSNNVVIQYNLVDNSAVTIEIDISEDGGATWTVTDTSVSGDIGAGISQGSGKTITWNAGTDFSGQSQVDMRVRVRGADTFTNSSGNVESADFLVDTLNPTTNVGANLQSQPNAGDTAVLIGGSFTEANPNTNNFYVAIDGGSYGSATAGDTNTASPANLMTSVGTTLRGNNYISKVKITHLDDYGHSVDNENLTPNVLYKYVKPYTPLAPTVSSPQNTSVDVTINPNTSEVSGLEYAIYENYTGNYVQADGTLGASAVWQATSTWATITVTGLSSPVANYAFQVKSRNSSDASHAATSESSLSSAGQISNTAPSIAINSASQQTGGVNYVLINYTGTDAQNDTNNLSVYEYSRDNSTWSAMTEKAGVGSDGTSGLIFASSGTSFDFAWDSGTDLPDVEDSTVYVRLRSTDTLANGNLAVSSAFSIDNRGPVVSNVIVSQTPASNNIIINYDLADNTSSGITVELDISEDGGSTWTVTDTSVTGNIGAAQTVGTDKSITWAAGVDFPNQEQSDMRVRIRGLDSLGNQGANTSSANFTLDTKAPVVSNVSASQTSGTSNVVINYDLSDLSPSGHLVQLDISDDGGATWAVTDISVTGNVGSGQSTGTGKTITWNAGTDYPSQEQADMRVRVRSLDYFSNQGSYASSSNFAVDTASPTITNISAVQNLGSSNVLITYDLGDVSNSNLVEIEISNDNGSTWTVTHTSATGDIGYGVTSGTGKTITWNAGVDFASEYQTDMKVRIRATDGFGNIGNYNSSSSFTVDTSSPVVSNVSATQSTGSNNVTISYDLSENSASSTVAIDISEDGGSTWTVTKTSVSGNIGSGQTAGTGKSIVWNAGVDFANQYQTDMQVRVRAVDPYANQSANVASSNFTLDTAKPVVSSVSAARTIGTSNVVFTYNLSDDTSSNLNVQIDISSDSGATWTVTDTSVSGAVGSGQTAGTGKTITWDAGTDFANQYQTDMQVRIRATDNFSNLSNYASSTDFIIDTEKPSVTNVSAVQNLGSTNVLISYDLSEATANSDVEIDISDDGGSTWTVTDTSSSGDVGSGINSGTNKTITWNADVDFDNQYQTDMQVRVRAIDRFNNISNYSSSANFSLDTANPVISNVSAAQVSGSTNVTIGYDLSENASSSTVEIDISSNGGSTWTVTDTSLTGDIGDGIGAGTGKTITWNAGVDFDEQQMANMRVRVRAYDSFTNYGAYASSADFALDTLNPSVNVVANLQAQPNAGSTTALIGGSFTETNPNTNNFYVAINGGSYGSATAGSTNTASPANLETAVGVTLRGSDYISAVKIAHSDDFGQSVNNENLSPATAYKYVKPYTPPALTVDNPTTNTVDVAVNKHASEVDGLDYAIYESSTGNYLQADGTLGTSPVWQSIASWGTKTVTGLSSPVAQYVFQTKSRNISDGAHAASSESTLSAGASAGNTAPAITFNTIAQTTDGTKYVVINYDGTDNESNTSSLVVYEYSLDNTNWSAMTEKSGVGSSGTSGLAFTPSGASLNFAWDVATDLPNTEDATVYVRLQARDGIINGNLETSSSFIVDTKASVISSLSAAQTLGAGSVVIGYNLADLTASGILIEIDISDDSGSNWSVTDSSVSGDVGSGVTAGVGKSIAWNVALDFANQYQTDMQVRLRATDNYGNQSTYLSSSNFTVDTAKPTVSNVSAAQVSASSNVLISYDLADNSSDNLNIQIDISDDGGASWTVTDTSVSGNVGVGQTTGTGKTIIWNAGTDFAGQNQSDMRVRVRAIDKYANTGDYASSANFTVDTANPVVSSVTAVQNIGSTNVIISYNLSDSSVTNTVELQISNDGGSSWTVSNTSVSGDVGAGISAGTGKTIVWAADIDFDGQNETDMRVRIRATDTYNNTGAYASSANFSLDTANPSISNISAAQNLGSTNVIVEYDLADGSGSNTVQLEISDDGGVSWTVTNTSVSGDVGTGISAGTDKTIVWAADTDYDGNYQTDMRVRVRAIDSYNNYGNYTASSNFTIDTANPIISSLSVAQNTGETNVNIIYNLSENASTSTVQIDISSDGGSTWTVTDTSVTGEIGLNISAGSNKMITWNAGVDFSNQYEADMQVRVRAIDNLGNQGAYSVSSNFTVDTASPVVTNVVARQNTASPNVIINYDLSENYPYSTVEIEVSDDGGITWNVTSSTLTGDVGTYVSAGVAKTITWAAKTDFPNQYQNDIKVRVRALDNNGNQGAYVSSANFAIDTNNPVISNLSASQSISSTNVLISYDLDDDTNSNLNIAIDISQDGGFTWNVTDTSVTGEVGPSLNTGTNKVIQWNAGVDFSGQDQSDIRVRLRATDNFGNQGAYFDSSNFSVDTQAPTGLANLSKFSSTDTSVTLNWSAGVADSNFNHYIIWHGNDLNDVNTRTGTANQWSVTNDSNLNDVNTISTVITGISVINNYYVKIWAIDNFGNEVTIAAVNFYEPIVVPTPAIISSTGFISRDVTSPSRPILTPLSSPTNLQTITISGLAEPSARVELFDNGQLVARLNSTADVTGKFSQNFNFIEGQHTLTVRAIDFSNNTGPFSDSINLVVDNTVPAQPIIQSHINGQDITTETLQLIGVSEPMAEVEILLDNANLFKVTADEMGVWRFILPSQFALSLGDHEFALNAIDQAGNRSGALTLALTKIFVSAPTEGGTGALPGGTIATGGAIPSGVSGGTIPSGIIQFPGTQTGGIITPNVPIPSEAEITQIAEAVELPGVPVPKVVQVLNDTNTNTFRFSGTALPNKDVVVYIHSNEALIYRTKTDAQGVWNIDHSQNNVELSSGEHSIFAVTVDADARVKSRPSLVNKFEVKKSFWVTIYQLLNLPTTAMVLLIIFIVMLWLYRIKKRVPELA